MLLDTQAGKKIKRLASHKEAAIAEAAAGVVATWKQTVKQEQLQTSASGLALGHCLLSCCHEF